MASTTRYKDLLDYTITYRAVWTTIGILVAFGVAGAIAWQQLRPPGEDEKARQDLKAAERLQARAESCSSAEPKPEEEASLGKARDFLGAAHAAIERKAYAETSAAAHHAADAFKDFIDRACAAREAVAQFNLIQGDVKVKKQGSPRWVPARKESRLAVGDRVWTLRGVARIIYPSGESLEMRSAGIVEIHDTVAGNGGMTGTETFLSEGEVVMKSVEGSPSTIVSPHATVEPGGDTVDVEALKGSETTHVLSLRGGARVRTPGGQTETLSRLQRVGVREGAIAETTTVLKSPELGEPMDNRVFTPAGPTEKDIVFGWREIPGAMAYVFQIARNDTFQPVLNEGDQERLTQLSAVVELPPNTYFWRVAGVDRQNVRGDWSEVRRMSVRGAEAQGKKPPPPKVDITNKVDLNDRVIIQGKTDSYVTLEVFLNGHKYGDVNVDENGEFQALVTLAQEGKNAIEIVAHDAYGQETRVPLKSFFTPF